MVNSTEMMVKLKDMSIIDFIFVPIPDIPSLEPNIQNEQKNTSKGRQSGLILFDSMCTQTVYDK